MLDRTENQRRDGMTTMHFLALCVPAHESQTRGERLAGPLTLSFEIA